MIIKILILLVLGYLAYRYIKAWMFPDTFSQKNVASKRTDLIDDVMIQDPFCGTYFPKRDAVHLKKGQEDLYFCSIDCRDKYLAQQSDSDMHA